MKSYKVEKKEYNNGHSQSIEDWLKYSGYEHELISFQFEAHGEHEQAVIKTDSHFLISELEETFNVTEIEE